MRFGEIGVEPYFDNSLLVDADEIFGNVEMAILMIEN